MKKIALILVCILGVFASSLYAADLGRSLRYLKVGYTVVMKGTFEKMEQIDNGLGDTIFFIRNSENGRTITLKKNSIDLDPVCALSGYTDVILFYKNKYSPMYLALDDTLYEVSFVRYSVSDL